MNDLEWANKLEHIANAMSETIYYHGLALDKFGGKRERFIMHDDYDLLRQLAKDLRVREYKRLLAEAEATK